jgi:hypothetical protein
MILFGSTIDVSIGSRKSVKTQSFKATKSQSFIFPIHILRSFSERGGAPLTILRRFNEGRSTFQFLEQLKVTLGFLFHFIDNIL